VSSVRFHLFSPIFLAEHITLSYLVTTLSSHVAGNSLLYLGAGGIAASAFLNYTAEKYAKLFIIGSLACFAGGVLFKSIEQSVKNMQWIDKLAQDKLETSHKSSVKKTVEQQPSSAGTCQN
jgi:hypothetical protein